MKARRGGEKTKRAEMGTCDESRPNPGKRPRLPEYSAHHRPPPSYWPLHAEEMHEALPRVAVAAPCARSPPRVLRARNIRIRRQQPAALAVAIETAGTLDTHAVAAALQLVKAARKGSLGRGFGPPARSQLV